MDCCCISGFNVVVVVDCCCISGFNIIVLVDGFCCISSVNVVVVVDCCYISGVRVVVVSLFLMLLYLWFKCRCCSGLLLYLWC